MRLRHGAIDIAVVGGAHLMLTPGMFETTNDAKMLSPTGVCSPFSDRADGMVRGEAAGAVVLMRMTTAEALGLRVYAAIDGIASGNNGRVGLTTPSCEQPASIMRLAQSDAGVRPSDVAALECHGTARRPH
jgi:acyl transferase domain-containing protein